MHDAESTVETVSFRDLSLSEPVLEALAEVGYESPSPIQAATIPHLLAGADVVGQAQTGTGKTAAFALPILSKIDVQERAPQALVLVPTRELAIQVAEAFQRYAARIPGFHVVPIYGGQSYTPQLQSLRRGVHAVVGTPGRIMDHIRRDTLRLSTVRHVVLDEADEMLRMGFIEDVERILEQVPPQRQISLFSATMPPEVRRIAGRYLREPAEVTVKTATSTASEIRQRYWVVSGMHKLDALTRILEVEPFDGMLVFTRTKLATGELAERLQARGFAAEALNGDIPQAQRERTIARLKARQIDIVVATDVAARGLDVERVSHVVNYDVPYDPESYVHRIGRTGRAGRRGDAILFIAPRERSMLSAIERATRQPIARMELPSIEDVNEQRVARFNQRIGGALASGEADAFRGLIERYESQHNVAATDIAAALASIAQGGKPLLLDGGNGRLSERQGGSRSTDTQPSPDAEPSSRRPFQAEQGGKHGRARRHRARHDARASPDGRGREAQHEGQGYTAHDGSMETYRIEVGHVHGVQPANIVGAIAHEARLEGKHIGRVAIRDDHSFVELPRGMPKDVLRHLQKVRVAGQKLQISRALKTQTARLRHELEHARRSRERDR